jgi:hypothetical protein
VRNSPWLGWFNSFGFITILVFSFAFLTTMEFPTAKEKEKFSRPYTLVKSDGGHSPERFSTVTASRYGAASGPVYVDRGDRSHGSRAIPGSL